MYSLCINYSLEFPNISGTILSIGSVFCRYHPHDLDEICWNWRL